MDILYHFGVSLRPSAIVTPSPDNCAYCYQLILPFDAGLLPSVLHHKLVCQGSWI
jgi:hypothetical protein